MCNPGKAISRGLGIGTVVDMATSAAERAVTLPGTGGRQAAAEVAAAETARQLELQTQAQQRTADAQAAQTDIAAQSAADALAATKSATARANAAATPAADSESATRAAEDRMRRLIAVGGVVSGKKTLGGAPVGYRFLTGS